MTVVDTSAAAHFVVEGADETNIEKKKLPIRITLPNGSNILSTHTCCLKLPGIPQAAKKAQIVPGLANTTLLSVAMFCREEMTVNFDEKECRVQLKGKTILRGIYYNGIMVHPDQSSYTGGNRIAYE